jgi:Smg-4/UPF3 family
VCIPAFALNRGGNRAKSEGERSKGGISLASFCWRINSGHRGSEAVDWLGLAWLCLVLSCLVLGWPSKMDNSGASSVGGGGRSNVRNRKSKKNRSRRRDNNSRRTTTGGGGGRRGAKRSKGPPAPPQTKILIRNIGDATKHGSVEGIIGLIRSFLDGANQKLSSLNSRVIQLHEASTASLIQGAEAVKKAQEEGKNKKSDENVLTDTERYRNDQTVEDAVTEEEEKYDNVVLRINEKSDWSVQDAPSVALSMAENSTTNFGARIVYIVPPKQTRRRGVKPGCAYLVISGPRIEAKESPRPPIPSSTTGAITTASSHSDPIKEEKKDVTEVGEKNGESDSIDEPATRDNSESHGEKENHVVIVDPPPEKNSSAAATTSQAVDYSREVAKGRFLVTQVIEMLEEHAKEDAKSEQRYAGSMVEVAMSGKTYKQNFHRRDRREGTLEQSADYKIFLAKAAKEKEERLARPKPAPGGGLSVVAAATSETAENGQPVAALVEHIRNKRAEASKRKKTKKPKDTISKEKGNNERSRGSRKKKSKDQGTIEEGGIKGGRRKEAKKGKRRDKKKNGKGEKATPTAVLKAGATTPGTTAATLKPVAP